MKYGNKKTKIGEIAFDSKLESQYYLHLISLQEKGEIRGFELQPTFVLQESFRRNGKTIRAIKYVADFKVEYEDHFEIVDVKGSKIMLKSDFKIKWKMMQKLYPDRVLKCVSYNKKLGWHDIL